MDRYQRNIMSIIGHLLIYLPGNYLVILASISVSKIYSHRVLNIVINEHWIWIPPCNWINCSDLMMTSRTWGLVRVPIIIPEWTMFQAGELLQFLQIYYISIKWQLSWLTMINTKTDWWFGTFFTFPYLGNNHPNWRTHSIIFQRAWYTNHQPVNNCQYDSPSLTTINHY